MLRRVVLVKTEVSEELIATIIRVTRIDELETTKARCEGRARARATRRNASEDNIFLLSYHEAAWSPFQTYYFSENLGAPGNEPGTCGSLVRSSGH
jgi:hypothetical protein